MLSDLISAGDAKVDFALAYECWNVGSRQEDESKWKVFHQRDVQSIMAVKLDVGA